MENDENLPFEGRVSKRTVGILKRNGVHLNYVERNVTKQNYAIHYTNSDLLQYYGVVQTFMNTKYGLERDTLEVLCAIRPIGLFTKSEFDRIPKHQASTLRYFMERKFVEFYFEKKAQHSKVYAVTNLGKKIVDLAHRYLLEPETIPVLSSGIEIPKEDQKKFRKIDRMIKRLKTS